MSGDNSKRGGRYALDSTSLAYCRGTLTRELRAHLSGQASNAAIIDIIGDRRRLVAPMPFDIFSLPVHVNGVLRVELDALCKRQVRSPPIPAKNDRAWLSKIGAARQVQTQNA